MDLRFTSEELAFRDDVRSFIQGTLPDAVRKKIIEGRQLAKDEVVSWQQTLNAKGWAVPHWPVEWGGTGWTAVQHYFFDDELQQAPAPLCLPFNVNMIGPVIAAFGTEAQKQRFLPRIANLDDWWCQGFSEPGAGSDLAALTTSARHSGDHYVVNGQKLWTSFAQFADWMFCLARTEPATIRKQQGISFLLIDMRAPGITVRPIATIDGGHDVNEVFLEQVMVPVENLVGQPGEGWNIAKFLLGKERTGLARVGTSKERIRRIKQLASIEQSGGRPLWENDRFRERVTAVEVELKALEMTLLRVIAAQKSLGLGNRPDPASSILKIKGTEIQQATSELLLEVAGPHAARYRPDAADDMTHSDWADRIAPTYFGWRKLSIFGGSNEIQKNIIAKTVLGL